MRNGPAGSRGTGLLAGGCVFVCVFGMLVVRAQSAPRVYEVVRSPFNARCDGHRDVARALQAAERAAADAGGGTVTLPAGRCVISTGIEWDSNVSLSGAGMYSTTLVATKNFGFGGRRVRRGENGRFIGMIWLDGETRTEPLRNVTIANVGFDPRAGTQSYADDPTGKGTYQCITANIRPLQHLRFQNLFFDLGVNPHFPRPGEANGPKGFFGIELPVLGVDPDNPSFDLSFSNIHGRNGHGTIQLALGGFTNRRGVTSSAHDITIDGLTDVVDEDNVADDRLVIDGVSNPAPGQLGRIENISIKNVSATVSDSVRIGGANAVKINPGRRTIIANVVIDTISFHGSPNGQYGAPLANSGSKNGSGSPLGIAASADDGFVRDVSVRNIHAVNTEGILLAVGAEPGQAVNTTLTGVTLTNCYTVTAALAVAAASPATGRDHLSISNFTIGVAPEAVAAGRPRGLYFTSVPGGGIGGSVIVQQGELDGYPTPIMVRRGFDGLRFAGVRWSSGQPEIHSAVQFI